MSGFLRALGARALGQGVTLGARVATRFEPEARDGRQRDWDAPWERSDAANRHPLAEFALPPPLQPEARPKSSGARDELAQVASRAGSVNGSGGAERRSAPGFERDAASERELSDAPAAERGTPSAAAESADQANPAGQTSAERIEVASMHVHMVRRSPPRSSLALRDQRTIGRPAAEYDAQATPARDTADPVPKAALDSARPLISALGPLVATARSLRRPGPQAPQTSVEHTARTGLPTPSGWVAGVAAGLEPHSLEVEAHEPARPRAPRALPVAPAVQSPPQLPSHSPAGGALDTSMDRERAAVPQPARERVTIQIGRIDVRASLAERTSEARVTKPARTPKLALDSYLQRFKERTR